MFIFFYKISYKFIWKFCEIWKFLWELAFRRAEFCEILSHSVRYGMYAKPSYRIPEYSSAYWKMTIMQISH